MKFIYTCFSAFILLLLTMAGCQKDDNFLVKEEAISVITSGFNGSNNELEVIIDTMTLPDKIQAGYRFKRTDKYIFPAIKDHVRFSIKDKVTGESIYEKDIKKGEYSLTISLIYANGKIIEKPVAPANNPEGIRLVSYLFLPGISGYTGDIDIAYLRKQELAATGQLVKLEELTRITAKPYAFSTFLQAPVIAGGRTEIDGIIYNINPVVMFYKSGTNIPYYEGLGLTLSSYMALPIPVSNKPQIVGITEWGTPADKYIENFQQIDF